MDKQKCLYFGHKTVFIIQAGQDPTVANHKNIRETSEAPAPMKETNTGQIASNNNLTQPNKQIQVNLTNSAQGVQHVYILYTGIFILYCSLRSQNIRAHCRHNGIIF